MITPTIVKVIAYAISPIFKSPFAIFAPAIVDEITEGNLANVDISMNLIGFSGNKPATYTNKSYGVPGIINSIAIISSIFL